VTIFTAEESMATMKAAQLVEYKKPYELRDVPIPKATGRDILIKVFAASFCHTDVSLLCDYD
jgi:propanol-preferring alcohol dehydrogenase